MSVGRAPSPAAFDLDGCSAGVPPAVRRASPPSAVRRANHKARRAEPAHRAGKMPRRYKKAASKARKGVLTHSLYLTAITARPFTGSVRLSSPPVISWTSGAPSWTELRSF